jgi:hypothetical protein
MVLIHIRLHQGAGTRRGSRHPTAATFMSMTVHFGKGKYMGPLLWCEFMSGSTRELARDI